MSFTRGNVQNSENSGFLVDLCGGGSFLSNRKPSFKFDFDFRGVAADESGIDELVFRDRSGHLDVADQDSGFEGIRAWQERSFAIYGDGGVMDSVLDCAAQRPSSAVSPVPSFYHEILGQIPTPAAAALEDRLNFNPKVATADSLAPPLLPSPSSTPCRKLITPFLEIGGFGDSDSEFSEPNGVELTRSGKVVVVDTNKHQIKFFDMTGKFLHKFGMPGKAVGKLLYPCKVALTPTTEDLVIIQRSPLPQVQIFDQSGSIRFRFGNDHLLVPRGVCVDENGTVIVMESKVMRCHLFESNGKHIRTLILTDHLRFPYDICAAKGTIFIADNQAHCIKLFDYQGTFLGVIGERVTRYPVSVKIVAGDKLLVADNHENFNVYLFSINDGQHLKSFYSRIKHAQCYDIAVNDDMYLVMTTKDFRVYGYRLPIDQNDDDLPETKRPTTGWNRLESYHHQ